MRSRKLIGILVVVIVAAVVGLVLLLISRSAPPTSTVQVASHPCLSSGQSCLVFPTVSGDNLAGQSITLPADFVGQDVLVIIPFDENQQVQAQAWLAPARDLAAHSGLAYYNVPVFPMMAAAMRSLIRAGMMLSIPDAQLRALTITVFLDQRDQFLAALDIPNADAMQVFLLDAQREVIWRGAGAFTSDQGDAVRALLMG